MDNIGKHSRSKVQAKDVDLGSQGLVDKVNGPIYHIMLNKGWDNGILNTALLQNGNTKSLCNTSIFLFFQNL